MPGLLGIECGATHTVALHEHGGQVARAEFGPANLRLLGDSPYSVPALVERMYVGLDPRLVGAAERSVLAHLIDLRDRNRVRAEGDAWALTT